MMTMTTNSNRMSAARAPMMIPMYSSSRLFFSREEFRTSGAGVDPALGAGSLALSGKNKFTKTLRKCSQV